MAFGLSAGYQRGRPSTSINYTRKTADGRYLMPMEWVRDPRFTFMPRERNEGFGDVHAMMGKINIKEITHGLSATVAEGYFDLPDVTTTRLNKYGMQSYAQVNLGLRYAFSSLLEGLAVQHLLADKLNPSETYGNNLLVISKVDKWQSNLEVN